MCNRVIDMCALVTFGRSKMIVAVSCFALLWGFVRCVDPLVQIDQGLVRGVISEDGTYSMFMGIPYAQIDKQRPFSDPIAAPEFSTIFEAYDDSAACPQKKMFSNSIVGHLDCLVANVYVPIKASTINKLPVMLYIHGGGFSGGSASRDVYGPKYLIQHDVILVTINYRLGPYGFMCLGTEDVPGNAGLKDQLSALRWVKKNVAYFSGDDENITLFGQSAGSMCTEYHILFHGSEGLFKKAILQSGTTFVKDYTLPDASNVNKLANYFGITANNTTDIIKSLSSIEPSEMIVAQSLLELSFYPCKENVLENSVPYMTQFAKDIISSGNYTKIPLIAGFVETETLEQMVTGVRSDPNYFVNTNQTIDKLVAIDIAADSMTLNMLTKLANHFYLGDKSATNNVTTEMTFISSDLKFAYTTERSMSYHLLESNPVYFYVFAFSSSRNNGEYDVTESGTSHGDDLFYLFEQYSYTDEITQDEQDLIDQMTTWWTNFAKYGDPTPQDSDLMQWPRITADTRPAMWIDKEPKIVDRPFAKRFAFWDLVFSIFDGYDLHYLWNT